MKHNPLKTLPIIINYVAGFADEFGYEKYPLVFGVENTPKACTWKDDKYSSGQFLLDTIAKEKLQPLATWLNQFPAMVDQLGLSLNILQKDSLESTAANLSLLYQHFTNAKLTAKQQKTVNEELNKFTETHGKQMTLLNVNAKIRFWKQIESFLDMLNDDTFEHIQKSIDEISARINSIRDTREAYMDSLVAEAEAEKEEFSDIMF